MSQLIRWVLILPAAVAAWYAALVIGIGLYASLKKFCPLDQIVSGGCTAPWYLMAEKAVVAFGAALAAVFVMTTCTFLAPSHKREIAITTFAIGSIVAIYMGAYLFFAQMVSAVIAGAITLFILIRRLAPPSLPNK